MKCTKSVPVHNYLHVLKADQNITFEHLIDRSVEIFHLSSAEASSGLPVHFELSDLSLASLTDDIVTLKNAGTLSVTASQSGDDSFLPGICYS